jgi:hypothetical protein
MALTPDTRVDAIVEWAQLQLRRTATGLTGGRGESSLKTNSDFKCFLQPCTPHTTHHTLFCVCQALAAVALEVQEKAAVAAAGAVEAKGAKQPLSKQVELTHSTAQHITALHNTL